MAEFQKVLSERERMCDSFIGCLRCPLGKAQKETVSCKNWTIENPKEAERIIMSWASEHPIMTNRKKFEEVFGFALDERCAMPITVLDWLDKEYQETE